MRVCALSTLNCHHAPLLSTRATETIGTHGEHSRASRVQRHRRCRAARCRVTALHRHVVFRAERHPGEQHELQRHGAQLHRTRGRAHREFFLSGLWRVGVRPAAAVRAFRHRLLLQHAALSAPPLGLGHRAVPVLCGVSFAVHGREHGFATGSKSEACERGFSRTRLAQSRRRERRRRGRRLAQTTARQFRTARCDDHLSHHLRGEFALSDKFQTG